MIPFEVIDTNSSNTKKKRNRPNSQHPSADYKHKIKRHPFPRNHTNRTTD